MATRVVVLGCGFAGLEAALSSHVLGLDEVRVSVIDKSDTMVYTPSLIWVPPRRKTLEELSIPLRPVLEARGIDCIIDEAVAIDGERSVVTVKGGREVPYDYLIIATGWRSKRRHIEGHEHALFPCDVDDLVRLTEAVGQMDGGSITFAISGERPGPGAEYIGWIDTYLREKGIRDRFTLNLAEEKHLLMIHMGKPACDMITEDFRSRDINLHLGENLVSVKPGLAVLESGEELRSDLTCAVGKLEAPEILLKLEFSSEDGFIPVHDDLTCKAFDNILVAGDSTAFDVKSVPKVAEYAIQQGQIAMRNLHTALAGGQKARFDAKNAFKNLFLLPDLGGKGVLAKHYKVIGAGPQFSSLKENIERYYLTTHRRGIPFNPFGH